MAMPQQPGPIKFSAADVEQAPTGPVGTGAPAPIKFSAADLSGPSAAPTQPDDSLLGHFADSSGLSSLVKIPGEVIHGVMHPVQTAEDVYHGVRQIQAAQHAATIQLAEKAAQDAAQHHYFAAMGNTLLAATGGGLAPAFVKGAVVQPVEKTAHELATPGQRQAGVGDAAGLVAQAASFFVGGEPSAASKVAKAVEAASEGKSEAEVAAGIEKAVQHARDTGYTVRIEGGGAPVQLERQKEVEAAKAAAASAEGTVKPVAAEAKDAAAIPDNPSTVSDAELSKLGDSNPALLHDDAANLIADAFAGRGGVDVPVTAQVGNDKSLGGKLTGMFGASVFGPAIVRVRNVQNSITQHLLESAFMSHLRMMQEGDAGLGATLLHSPLALGRRTAQAVLDTAQQIYGRLDAVAGNAQVMVPSELALNAGPLDNQALLERLAAFTDGSGSDFQYVPMTLRQVQQRRAALGRIAAHASNDTDAMLAGAKTRAFDRAITDSLSAFDSSAEGQRALKLINLKSASAAYRQASALWGDGSAISRVTEKFNSALGMPTEAVDAATDPNKVLWNFQNLQRVVNDPKNLPDLIRTFGNERNVRQFRQMVSLSAEDGGRSYSRLAGAVGSLFLGNYPVYRGVWTAAAGHVSGMITVAVMMAGYKMLADLATMRGGPTLIANALGALRIGKDVTKTGAVLALAAKAARAGFAQSGLDQAGGSASQPPSPSLLTPSAPTVPATSPAAPAPGQPGLP